MSEPKGRKIRGGDVLDRVSDAVVGVDSDFEYTFANTQAEQLLDTDEEALLGETIWEAFPETVDTIAETNIRNALETGQEQSYERYNETLDRWFELRIFPDDEGLSIFFTDISERKQREAELERYEELIETLPVAAGMNKPGEEGQFEFVNQAAVDLLGAESEAELKEYSPADTYANEHERKQFSEQLREEGTIDQYEVQLTTLDGEPFWASMTAKIAEVDGEEYIIGIIEDISERKANEQELRYKTRAIEDAPIGVSLSHYDQDDNPLVYVNERFEEITGYTTEEVMGRDCRFLQGKGTDDEAATTLRSAIEAGEPTTVELRNYRKDGEMFWNRVSIAPVSTDNGLSHYVGFQQDITEAKQRELAVERSNERITAQNQALGSFADIVSDPDRSVDEQIPALLELGREYLDLDFGIVSHIEEPTYTVAHTVTPDDTIEAGDEFELGDTFCSLVYDADGPVSFHNPDDGGVKDHPAYQKQGIRSYLGVPIHVAGERYGTLNFSDPTARHDPITEGEESFVRMLAEWIGAALERHQQQEELERTSEFLRQTQEVAQIGGWEFDIRSETMRWSDQVYRIHDQSRDVELTPQDGIEFYHPDDRDTIREAFDALTTEGEPYDLELRIITADDDVRWVRTRGEPRYENEEIIGVHGTFQDITERKRREEQLERAQQIIDNSTDIATIIDSEGTITYVSPAVTDVLGYSPDELIGTDGFGYQPDETSEAVADAIADVLNNPTDSKTVQTQFRRADGSLCWIESTLRNKVDNEVINGVLVSSRDVSERKERKQELKRQNERLEEFVSVVSHDLRNPLGIAQGRAAMLDEVTAGEYHDHLRPLGDALERMEEIITNTLTLARQGDTVGEMNPVSLVDLVGRCWASIETNEATLNVDDDITLQGDSDRLRHVFENLFRNAIEHGGDDVAIHIGHTDDGRLYVEDDGPGIPPDEREIVLEAGHTSAAGGTGFGLTIVKRIAEAHGWTVSITESCAGGARFEFDNVTLTET